MTLRLASLAFMLLLLASCQMGMHVTVSGSPAAPTFGLDDGDGGAPVSFLSIADESRQTVWEVSGPIGNCTRLSSLRYGDLPQGYTEQGRPPALQPGRLYTIGVSGCGHIGGAWFKIIGDRIVYREGDGDAPRDEVEALR
jgi:hypothetical protein